MTTEARLGTVEGRVEEHAAAIADVRAELRGLNARLDALHSRIDRVFLAVLGMGAAQIALLITLIFRS